jgi:hypothetical protein
MLLAMLGVAHDAMAACFQKPVSNSSDPYEYVLALVDSYSWAHTALSRTETKTDREQDSFIADIVDRVYGLKLAKNDYQCAAEAVSGFRQSRDEAIKTSADGAHLVYLVLKQLNDESIGELLKIVDVKNTFDIPATVSRVTDIGVKINEVWRTLPVVTAAASHALVQMPAGKDERLSTLKITSEQRKAITSELLKTFGAEIKVGMKAGQISLVASAGLLYQFVSDERWKSSDSK